MEDFKERVKKWRRTASVLHGIALESQDREECNYQLGKIAVCDMIIKDIDEQEAKRKTSKEGDKEGGKNANEDNKV